MGSLHFLSGWFVNSILWLWGFQLMGYSNKRTCTFISGKVCFLGSIKVRRQTLPEINVYARLFGTLEETENFF